MNKNNFGNAAWGFREMDIESQLKITSSMGLDIHELGIANAPLDIPLDVSNERLDEVKAAYEKYNVRLLTAATGNDFTNSNTDDIDKVKRVIDICSYLGIKYLRIFAGFSPIEEVVGKRYDIMVGAINLLADYAASKSVVLAIETHGKPDEYENGEYEHYNSITTDPESIKKLLNDFDCRVMFNYDPANLYAVGIKNPDSVFRIIKDRVAYVHLKDFKKMPSGHIKSAACGESGMDWNDIMKGIDDFNGPMLFEYEILEDLEDGLKKSFDYIMKIVDKQK